MSPFHMNTHTGLQTLTGVYTDKCQFSNSWLARPLILEENMDHKSHILNFIHKRRGFNLSPQARLNEYESNLDGERGFMHSTILLAEADFAPLYSCGESPLLAAMLCQAQSLPMLR